MVTVQVADLSHENLESRGGDLVDFQVALVPSQVVNANPQVTLRSSYLDLGKVSNKGQIFGFGLGFSLVLILEISVPRTGTRTRKSKSLEKTWIVIKAKILFLCPLGRIVNVWLTSNTAQLHTSTLYRQPLFRMYNNIDRHTRNTVTSSHCSCGLPERYEFRCVSLGYERLWDFVKQLTRPYKCLFALTVKFTCKICDLEEFRAIL